MNFFHPKISRHLLLLISSTLFLVFFSCSNNVFTNSNYQQAPFKGYDKLCTNDWWNRNNNKIINLKVDRNKVIAFGIYTVSENTLKLTAQLFPLYPNETRVIQLNIFQDNKWVEIQKTKINEIGWSATFRIENWDDTEDVKYKIRYGLDAFYEGLIRKNPMDKSEFSFAALSCNSNRDIGNRQNYVRNINYQDPDLIFFAGDQSYHHKEHTAAWLKFGMQFRDIFRNRPCITIPDDHDVGQLNLWGENGKKAKTILGVKGGYHAPDDYVKMVERCQTAHLPDPFDNTPIDQNINTYYTHLIWGGMDFAILEDRKFKSGPSGKINGNGSIRGDLIKKKNYNPKDIDLPNLKLLGERQLDFLKQWANSESKHQKVVLSQTGFCNTSHLAGRFKKRIVADLDTNGWPQTGRNKALQLIKEANAFHVAGDQHLGTVIQHGIDKFEDGPFAFTVPAIVNDVYSRWWSPIADNKMGHHLDGFGNLLTMHAFANPNSHSGGSGYGLVRIHKSKNEVTLECWPLDVDVSLPNAKQFDGWPVSFGMN